MCWTELPRPKRSYGAPPGLRKETKPCMSPNEMKHERERCGGSGLRPTDRSGKKVDGAGQLLH